LDEITSHAWAKVTVLVLAWVVGRDAWPIPVVWKVSKRQRWWIRSTSTPCEKW
jgi:hypothetical protein